MWNTYDLMTELYLQSKDKGLDSTSFRKFKYRMAMLREMLGMGPGAGIMRELIAENPNYDKYYLNLRWMLWDDAEACEDADQSENELVKAMFNKEVPDAEFMQMLSGEREHGTAEFVSFRKFINGLKLALGY